MRAWVVGVLVALLLPLSARTFADSESSCVRCHSEEEDSDLSRPVEEWSRSVHAVAEVSCDACHGGNPFEDDEDLAMDEDEAGFLGVPDWEEEPEFCGACHEKIADGYGQSVMAAKLREGKKVAVCTTCHMTDGHAILSPTPREILTEERCGRCHDGGRAIVLRDLLEEINARLGRARADLDATRHWIDVSVQDQEVEKLSARAVVIAHTYDAERIAEVAAVAHERLEGVVIATASLSSEAGFRRRLGAGTVAFLLAMCVGVVRLGTTSSAGSGPQLPATSDDEHGADRQ